MPDVAFQLASATRREAGHLIVDVKNTIGRFLDHPLMCWIEAIIKYGTSVILVKRQTMILAWNQQHPWRVTHLFARASQAMKDQLLPLTARALIIPRPLRWS
jgi:hypothetical protein